MLKGPVLAREGLVDIREDEEQNIKLQQIIDLLLSAGYFRAQIKTLTPFDKVTGGLTWLIENCSIDVDVDLFYDDMLSIGQKIALTEHIVAILPYMKCPHRIEPYQIQGLDAVNILPVFQWLIKQALKFQAEHEDENRQFALLQYSRYCRTPEEERIKVSSKVAMQRLAAASEEDPEEVKTNKQSNIHPVRYRLYKNLGKDLESLKDELEKTQCLMIKKSGIYEEAKKQLEIFQLQQMEFKKEFEVPFTDKMAENHRILNELSNLISQNDEAKKEEMQFKDECRKQSDKMREEIRKLDERLKTWQISKELLKDYKEERESYCQVRLELAKMTRALEAFKKYIDGTPGRAELSQYQKRFIELYNQVTVIQREAQQFFTMFNSLTDAKIYMEKELNLMNSVYENLMLVIESPQKLNDYLRQLENIGDGINQNKTKLEKRKCTIRGERSAISRELNNLQELGRNYAATVKILSSELMTNEILNEELKKVALKDQ